MTESIVLAICDLHKVTPEDFFGPLRTRKLAKVRCAAVIALCQSGFSNRAIARMIRRNYSTVQYWLRPEYRERRQTYNREARRLEAMQ